MKKAIIISLILSVTLSTMPVLLKAQLALQWTKFYPNYNLTLEVTASDSIGNTYATAAENNGNYHLLKYDSLSNLIWDRIFLPDTGFFGPSTYVYDLIVDSDYIYTFFSSSFSTYDMGFACFNKNGIKRYEKGWVNGIALGLLPERNGSVYFTFGNGNNSLHLAKFDSTGNQIFDKPIPNDSSASHSFCYRFMKYDRNHILNFFFGNPTNLIFCSLDSSGNLVDSTHIQNGINIPRTYAFDNTNNKYFFKNNGSSSNLVKYDPAFNLIWEKGPFVGGWISQMEFDSQNNLYALNVDNTAGADTNLLYKIDSAGIAIWVHPYNAGALFSYFARSLVLDGNDNPLVAGYKHDVPATNGYDPTNRYFFEKRTPNNLVDGYYEGYDSASSSSFANIPVASGSLNYFVLGSRGQLGGGQSFLKLQRFCSGCSGNSVNDEQEIESIFVYPNPAHQYLHFKMVSSSNKFYSLKIYNPEGQLVIMNATSRLDESLDVSSLTEGLYILEISNDQVIYRQRFIRN